MNIFTFLLITSAFQRICIVVHTTEKNIDFAMVDRVMLNHLMKDIKLILYKLVRKKNEEKIVV